MTSLPLSLSIIGPSFLSSSVSSVATTLSSLKISNKCGPFRSSLIWSTLSLISMGPIITTIVLSISLNLLLTTNNPVVYSWNWDQHISEELLDRFICLRAKGFFPHEHRCDHFYECRNGTIINEGICRPGLRFDYRYRKKPRCIPIDQIDCRITQIDYNEYIDTPEPTFIPTVSTSTTTPSPSLLTIHRHIHHPSTNARMPPFGTSTLSSSTHQRSSTNILNSPANTSPISFRHFTTFTTANQFSPSVTMTTSTIGPIMSATTATVASTTTTTTTEAPQTTMIIKNNHHKNDDIDEENFLSKKRKLLKKPLKLRRGRLQKPNDEMDDTSSPSSGDVGSKETPRLTEQILSRAISTLNFENPRAKSIHCPHPNGYYADRDDCRKFYACDDGRAFLMSCPLGLAYDEMTGTCSWPDMVEGCRSEEMLRFSCPEPNENEILDYGDPRYPTSDCRKFVVCIQSEIHGTRTPRLLGCEEGLVFNPNSRECDYPENVPSCSNYYEEQHLSRSISRSISTRKRKNRF